MGAGTELPTEMRALLERGGLLLTGSARAAREVRRRFAEAMRGAGRPAWPTPLILDLNSWLETQWSRMLLEGAEDRALLSPLQERHAWELLIAPPVRRTSLLEPARLADLAREAFALLASHRALDWVEGPAEQPDGDPSEPALFRGWARLFRAECLRRRWLPHAMLPSAVSAACRRGGLSLPAEIGWLGQDQITPAVAELRDALDASGVRRQELAWHAEAARAPRRYEAADERQENLACARWVRERLNAATASGATGTSGHAGASIRIGIVMPDLAGRRPQLERALHAILARGPRADADDERAVPVPGPAPAPGSPRTLDLSRTLEFSLGQPLSQVPLVHAALLLLRWVEQPLAEQEISWLLLSSTLAATAGETARAAMAAFDRRLRSPRLSEPSRSLAGFLRLPLRSEGPVAGLLRDLGAMQRLHRGALGGASGSVPGGAPRRNGVDGWLRHACELLRAAGWGARDASSLLYQARASWEELLEQMASLEAAAPSMPYGDFLKLLKQAAGSTIFSPESQGAPVQVMGVFAAAGLCFDAVWFLGATDGAWPPTGAMHPLLPYDLQRRHGMPHAAVEDDVALGERVMARLAASAGEVVYSWARSANGQTADEGAQRPSPLLGRLDAAPDPEAASGFLPSDITDIANQAYIPYQAAISPPTDSPEPPPPLEAIEDGTWVPLPCDAPAPGGQDALRRQAACPFQSFAHHRLRAVELEVAGRGLSAAERGNLVHWTLEGLWSVDTDEFPHLGSLEDLREAAAGGLLQPRVEVHAARAMARLNAADDSQWQRNYLTAERKRLVDLVLRWLKHEGRRESFRVLSAEKQEQVRVGPLTLNVRADRIDQVAGGTLLIDYKTGSASRPASWEGPRPEEPQLPLYAGFVAPDDLVGAVFGKVLPEKECFAGLVQDAGLNLMKDSKLNPLTPEIRQQWRIDLEALAASFAQGEAQVDPRDGQETCRYCPLTALCRVAETGARNLGEDAGDTAAEDTGVPAP